MKNNDMTPLLKFIDSNTDEGITEDSLKKLSLSKTDKFIIENFYHNIQQVNSAFERRFWKNDLEIIEISLFKIKENWKMNELKRKVESLNVSIYRFTILPSIYCFKKSSLKL